MGNRWENSYICLSRALAAALGERDSSTGKHCDRVVALSVELGRHCDFSGRELDTLALGAQFHDIGKIGIPDRILQKPAPFDAEEWGEMKKHPVIGERIVRALESEYSDAAAQVVRHHHEHFDGSGYPDGLVGDQIPIYSRIISLADSYDALAAERPYHPPRAHGRIMEILHSEIRVKHDPDLLYAFCAVIERSESRARDH